MLRQAVPDDSLHISSIPSGMRHCQAKARVYALMKDELYLSLNEKGRENITGRILAEVQGRMLEDIILPETSKALGNR